MRRVRRSENLHRHQYLLLNAAILADVDIIISGDKHFLELDLERPCTMKAADYLSQFAE